MDYFAMQAMQALIGQAQGKLNFPTLFLDLSANYNLDLIEGPAQCLTLAVKINNRMRKSLGQSLESGSSQMSYARNWVLCQYKLFKTVLLLYSICHSIQIADMKEEHLQQLGQLFPWKERTIIDYEVATLANKSMKSLKQWTYEENTLLSSIIQKQDDPNWKEVAIELYRLSDKRFFRQFSECREQWNNHLNPTITKTHWTRQEDFRLVQLIEEYGFRWALISKTMNGIRNEHMVKNRYNSLVKKLKNGEGKKAESKVAWEEELLLQIHKIHYKAEKTVTKKTKRTNLAETRPQPMEKDIERIDQSLTELSESNKLLRVDTTCQTDELSIDKYLTLDLHLF